MQESLWRATAQPSKFRPLIENAKTDVLIVGGGMAGILCAYFLKKAGIDCLLIEKGKIGCGISGNTTAKITSQHGLIYQKLEKAFSGEFAKGYWLANEAALSQFILLSKQISCDMEVKDNYIFRTTWRNIFFYLIKPVINT
jgi:glycine/D-amino acid oxidase-like deaminating enzyme